MLKKILVLTFLLLCSGATIAAISEEPPPAEDTKVVLLKASTPLGETQVNLVKNFIETTLSVRLNLNASKAGKGLYRYESSRAVTAAEQQLIGDTLPPVYEVIVSFPVDLDTYDPSPEDGDGGGSASLKKKKKI